MSTLNSTTINDALGHTGAGTGRSWEASRFYRWWFAPESSTNLALCRILFFALIFQHQLGNRYSPWAGLPKSFFKPVWLFEFLHLPVLPVGVVFVMEVVWKAALLASCIGLLTRVSTWLSALLGVYLIGLQYNYGKVDHMTAMFLFTTGVMALSRCGDALSVDAWIRRRRDPSPVPPSGEYRWPVRMVWVLMSVIFFNAGMAKVIRGGVPWVFSENFSILLVQRHYLTSTPPLDWGLWIARHPLLYQGAAAGTILIEVFLFLALFSRRVRMVLPWMLLGMQIGIGLLMRVWFTPYMYVYLFWIPWDKVAGWARGGGRRTGLAVGAANL